MPRIYKLLGRIVALLVINGMLNACQRASYSLPVANRSEALLRLPQATVGQVSAASPALLPNDALPRTKRMSRSRHHGLFTGRHLVTKLPQLMIVNGATAATAEPVRLGRQKRLPVAAEVAEPPLRQRSRTVAIILAALSVAYIPLGLHNFYLGYYGRGALTIGLIVVGLYLLLLGTIGFLAASSSLTAVGVLGLGMLIGAYCWQLVDLIRIATGSLQPKGGSYRDSKKRP